MMRKYRDEFGLVALLKGIINRWPKTPDVDIAAARHSLGDDLADDFDPIDLLNPVRSIAGVEAIETTGRRITIRFRDSDWELQQAIFESSPVGKWQLKSLKFQCPVCFGTGVNDGEACTMCGSCGWGAS